MFNMFNIILLSKAYNDILLKKKKGEKLKTNKTITKEKRI